MTSTFKVASVFFVMAVIAVHADDLNPFPSRVLKELQFVGGTVGSSSVISEGSAEAADHAFQRTTNQFWHSGRDSKGRGDPVIPFPHLIWYEFKSPVLPGRVSFRPRHDTGCGAAGYWCGATKWQFIGTNDEICDENSAWTILCEDLSGRHFERPRQSKYCEVGREVKGAFRCLGISVLDSSYQGGYSCVSLGGIRMWKRPLEGWKSVFIRLSMNKVSRKSE